MSRIARLSIIFYTAWRFNLFGLICDNLKPGVRKTLLGLLTSSMLLVCRKISLRAVLMLYLAGNVSA